MSMIMPNDTVAREILEFIKKRLELPDNIIGLSLHLNLDEAIRVDCQYYPSAKPTSEESA